MPPSYDEMWDIPLEDLVELTLDESETLNSKPYRDRAVAVLHARLLLEPAESAAQAARWTAIGTFLLVLATVALVIVSLME